MKFKLKRFDLNPVLQPRPLSWWDAAQIRNPAAVVHDGKIHLIYTATGDIDIEHKLYLGHAVSTDGFHFDFAGAEPFAEPSATEFDGFDAGGMEDPRAVKIDGRIYITYCARSVPHWSFIQGQRLKNPPTGGVTWTENYRRGGLLMTDDLKSYQRLGPVTTDDHYDCNIILFPERINGKYVMLHRPSGFKAEIEAGTREVAGINICFSNDLIHWEDDQVLLKNEFPWETGKIGGATPPVKTAEGWLTLYHAVEARPAVCNWHQDYHFCYRTGVMLLDLEDPRKVLARAPHPILEPQTNFEKFGTVNNVVFATGIVEAGDELLIYYGAADTVVCVATANTKKLLDFVLNYRK
jgi:beta-1,2-mannobiose phosphorylase / 1,2-beta-oligomannan phosphorylase